MTRGIDTATLCRLAGIGESKLFVWLHRGVDLETPERRGQAFEWDMAQAFQVVLFARLLGRNRDMARAGEDAHSQTKLVGTLIAGISTGRDTSSDRVILIDALLADGERWLRLVSSAADLERLMAVMLRRGIRRLDLDDITAKYTEILEAFAAARAEPRQRAKVLA